VWGAAPVQAAEPKACENLIVQCPAGQYWFFDVANKLGKGANCGGCRDDAGIKGADCNEANPNKGGYYFKGGEVMRRSTNPNKTLNPDSNAGAGYRPGNVACAADFCAVKWGLKNKNVSFSDITDINKQAGEISKRCAAAYDAYLKESETPKPAPVVWKMKFILPDGGKFRSPPPECEPLAGNDSEATCTCDKTSTAEVERSVPLELILPPADTQKLAGWVDPGNARMSFLANRESLPCYSNRVAVYTAQWTEPKKEEPPQKVIFALDSGSDNVKVELNGCTREKVDELECPCVVNCKGNNSNICASVPGDPDRGGYTFDGWERDGLEGLFSSVRPIGKNGIASAVECPANKTELYTHKAKWTVSTPPKPEVKLTFDPNDGNFDDAVIQNLPDNEDAKCVGVNGKVVCTCINNKSFVPGNPKNGDKVFEGWVSGKVTINPPNQARTESTDNCPLKDTILKAKWGTPPPKKYAVFANKGRADLPDLNGCDPRKNIVDDKGMRTIELACLCGDDDKANVPGDLTDPKGQQDFLGWTDGPVRFSVNGINGSVINDKVVCAKEGDVEFGSEWSIPPKPQEKITYDAGSVDGYGVGFFNSNIWTLLGQRKDCNAQKDSTGRDKIVCSCIDKQVFVPDNPEFLATEEKKFTFGGWRVPGGGVINAPGSRETSIGCANSIEFAAIWTPAPPEPPVATVTYKLDSSDAAWGAVSAPCESKVVDNESVVSCPCKDNEILVPGDPSETKGQKRDFAGWSGMTALLNAPNGTRRDKISCPPKDVVLKATWAAPAPAPRVAIFSLMDDNVTPPADLSQKKCKQDGQDLICECGDDQRANVPGDPSLDGSTFDGWKDTFGNGPFKAAGVKNVSCPEEKNFYRAVWTPVAPPPEPEPEEKNVGKVGFILEGDAIFAKDAVVPGCKPYDTEANEEEYTGIVCECDKDGKTVPVPGNPKLDKNTFDGWRLHGGQEKLDKDARSVACNPDGVKAYAAVWTEVEPDEPEPLPVPIVVDLMKGKDGILDIWKRVPKMDADGWRSAEGGFNTTRLLADAAGGAVIGTAAGVLTNVLMKKSQLKSGYESVQCVYGNAGAAAFGEQFIVQ
jgi:hypothetical protein